MGYRKDLQGLRAAAILLVVLYHSNFSIPQKLDFGGGYVGVDVFFVLSGYVVGGVLFRELFATGAISVYRFISRRAARLLPALGLVIAVVLGSAAFTVSLGAIDTTVKTGLAATFFTANLSLWSDSKDYFVSDNAQNPLLHTWSLSLEEQVYIFFILALFTALSLRRKFPKLPRIINPHSVVAVLFASSLTLMFIGPGFGGPGVFYSPFTRGWQFFLGAVVYLFMHERTVSNRLSSKFSSVFVGMGAALILYAAVFFDDSIAYPGAYALLPSVGTAMMITGGSVNPRGYLTRLLGIRPVVWLGNLSYSWYLWHWPFIVFADLWWHGNDEAALAAALLAIVPATLSHRFVEIPFRSRGLTTKRSWLQLVAISFLLPVASASALCMLNNGAFRILEENESFIATIRYEQETIETQVASPSDATEHLDYVLVGDSHAASMAAGLTAAAAEYGKSVGLISQGRGCLLLSGPYTGTPDENCEQWQQEALAKLVSAPIDTVILNGYATGRLTGFNRGNPYPFELTGPEGTPVTDYPTALRFYESGLSSVVSALVESGKKVVLLTTFPDFTRELPTAGPTNRTTIFQVYTGTYPQISVNDIEIVPLEAAQDRNRDLLSIEQEVAARYAEVVSVDLSPEICIRGECRQWRDGTLIYSDLDHITSTEAFRLSKILLTKIDLPNNME